MDRPESQDPSWEQLQLLDADLVEITYKFGVWKSQDHCQVELEVKDPASGSTIALSSRHHMTLAQALDVHGIFARELYTRIADLTGPF